MILKIMRFNNNHFIFLIIIFFINIVAHFLPFERSALSPDDYSLLFREKTNLLNFLTRPDRPLAYIWIEFQSMIVGDNSQIGFILTFTSSLLTIFASYIFFFLIFKDKKLSFILTIIYSLIFNKLEIFHTPMMTHINIATLGYMVSFIFFLLYFKKRNLLIIIFSYIFYCIGVFWYEVGFFLPLAFIFYYFLYKNNIKLKELIIILFPFFVIGFFYIIYRLTGVFGSGRIFDLHTPSISAIPSGLIDVFHNFFGRSFLRHVIYGLYSFFNINKLLICFFIITNTLLVFFIYKFLNKNKISFINLNTFIIAIIIFFVFLIPNIIHGAIGGRSTIISSIGLTIIIFFIVSLFKKKFAIIFSFLFFFGLIICQGNAWNQVVASRINNSVYETIKEYNLNISQSKYLIIDTHSFAKNINHSLINNESNVLNTYFGAQTFEDWGLFSLVSLALLNFKNKPKTYIASGGFEFMDNNQIRIIHFENIKYRKKTKKNNFIPADKVFVLDYSKVYKKGFYSGKRIN